MPGRKLTVMQVTAKSSQYANQMQRREMNSHVPPLHCAYVMN